MKIHILNIGTGNIHSVYKKLNKPGISVSIGQEARSLDDADKIILPGVGHFAAAMDALRAAGCIGSLQENVLIKKKPVLGICLGMQMMAMSSEEGQGGEGLGWFKARVRRFRVDDTVRYKVPHTGWNAVTINKESSLLKDIRNDAEFYFVHSFHFDDTASEDILCTTDYAYPFVSAVERDNIFGVQFHPEKSHDNGDLLLNNFIRF